MWWLIALIVVVAVAIGVLGFMDGRKATREKAQRKRIWEALGKRPFLKYEEDVRAQFWAFLKDNDLDSAERMINSLEPLP